MDKEKKFKYLFFVLLIFIVTAVFFLSYFLVIRPQFNSYVIKKQIEEKDATYFNIFQQIEDKGAVYIYIYIPRKISLFF